MDLVAIEYPHIQIKSTVDLLVDTAVNCFTPLLGGTKHGIHLLLGLMHVQDVSALQYQAELLTNKATAEKDDVHRELNRLSGLVMAFQAHVAEVSQLNASDS